MLRRRGRTLAGGRRRGNQEREGQIEQGDQDEGGETGTALAECLTLCSEGPARGTKGDGTATVSAGPIQGVGPPRWGRHLKKEEKGEAGSLVRSRAATKTGHARSAGDAFKDDCLNDEDLELLLKSGAFFDTPPRDGEAAFMNDGQLRLMLRPETTARGRRDEGWPLRAADVEEQWTFLEKEEGSNGETGEGHSLGDCDFQSALSDLGEASDGRLGAEVENENREGWPEGSARILGKQGRSHGVKGRAKRDTFSKDDLQKRRAGDGGGVAGRDSGEGAPLQRDSAKGLTPLLLDGASIAFEHGRQRRLSPLGVSFAVARVFELGLPAKVLLPFWLAGEEHFYPTFFLGNAKGVALWQQVRQGLQEDSMLVVLPDPNAHLPEESHARWYPTRDCFKSLSDALEIARLCKQWGAALCSNDFEQFLRLVVGQKNKKMAEIYDFVSRSSVLLAFHKNEMHLILDSQGGYPTCKVCETCFHRCLPRLRRQSL
ncbi:conserved hypothetical protein [Neospora caninum Liverpool]|uniref:RNase NYN domain-containing protein n=1 Tax=Neospora caninum (strain Liverpool) TaxID=572307 RepID=F0VM67_NEOCL|nr:conserved hypothetical protein [Neospora caninum Liverpool]CBZ54345.1 conserved hypothetical protein [Neospora caninum Liverpool]|eukprot:XP_003884376.1 conserved hypothetical protein [Neospora caninum Liverpool]